MIILTVCLFGTKRGVLAGAVGAFVGGIVHTIGYLFNHMKLKMTI